MNAVKEDVMRIANASYYVGRGEYELFIRNSDKEIVKRKVQLGDSNFEFVEVIGGLQPGDEVVVEVEGVGRLVNRIVSEEMAK